MTTAGRRTKGRADRVAAAGAAGLLGLTLAAFVLFLRGCATEHYRGLGQSDIGFAVSPRGDRIVFNAAGQNGRDLFLLDLRTRRVTRVAQTPAYEVDPAFSPDGRTLVYAAGLPGDRADHLFVRSLGAAAAPARQLTFGDMSDATPSFTRDGKRIVFARAHRYLFGGLRHGGWDDWHVNEVQSDGTGLRQLSRADQLFGHPPRRVNWSEGYLVFEPPGVAGAAENRVRQTLGALRDVSPPGTWIQPQVVPGTTRILFLVERWQDGGGGVPARELWEVDTQSTRPPHRLATSALFSGPLTWRP